MTKNDLSHRESYEWHGTFWLPENNDTEKYYGKLSYSPTDGIKLSLQKELDTENQIKRDPLISKKIMHGNVHRTNGPQLITLFNVIIDPRIWTFNGCSYHGSASGLIIGIHCFENDINFISYEYDEHYENFFLLPNQKEENAILFDKGTPLTLTQNREISLRTTFVGTGIHSVDEIDSIFFSIYDNQMTELKNAMEPILDSKKHGILRRDTTRFHTVHKLTNEIFDSFIKHEANWRLFFELLIDHPISIETVEGSYSVDTSDGESRIRSSPMLLSNCIPRKQNRKPSILQHLPINFSKLSQNSKSISEMKVSVQGWYDIKSNEDWSPVIDCIDRLKRIDDAFGDASQFSMLVADIETLFDLIDGKKRNIDTLIEKQSTPKWRDRFSQNVISLNNKTIGQNLANLRNAIVHPRAYANNDKGVYSALRKNSFKLQAAYAYLGALYIKQVLEHLKVGNEEIRDEFSESFIDRHAHLRPITFD